MATQTGSIDLSASNGVRLYAEAGFETAEETYSTKSELEVAVGGVSSRVTEVETDVEGLGTRMSSAESGITQNATAISSKVSQADYTGQAIASLINQSASTVTIQAQHIELDGAVTFAAVKGYADEAYDPLGSADDAARVATDYITRIDGGGISVHDASADEGDYAQLDGDGLSVLQGGESVAFFGTAQEMDEQTEELRKVPSARIGPAGGARAVVTSEGLEVVNDAGRTVATFGASVRFDADSPQYIGGDDAYIAWYDSDDDGVADSLVIEGATVRIGSGQTLAQLLDALAARDAALQTAVDEAAAQAEADLAELSETVDAIPGAIASSASALEDKLSADIDATNASVDAANDRIDATNDSVTVANQRIDGTDRELASLKSDVNAYFDFGRAGLTISKSDSPFSLLLTEDRISFQQAEVSYVLTADTAVDESKTYYARSGSEGSYAYTAVASPVAADLGSYYERTVDRSEQQELAYASGDAFVAPTMEVEDELRMGGWAWVPRSNGNLALKWIGE